MERDAAGGVCGGETDVERTGGETDVVVAGVVDTIKSGKSVKHTNTFKIMIILNTQRVLPLKLSKTFPVTCTGESSVLFAGAVSVVFQGERTVPQVNLIPSALDTVQPHNTFTSTKD